MASLPNLQEGQILNSLVSTVGFTVYCVVTEWRRYELLLAWPLKRIRSPENTLPVADPI
jgi:hypothetical protein